MFISGFNITWAVYQHYKKTRTLSPKVKLDNVCANVSENVMICSCDLLLDTLNESL